MAITRAQQVRQMLKNGKVAMQGGVKNYLGKKKTVTVPKDWQSSPDHPTTKLAYITKAEKDLLLKKDLHNSLNGKPNRGPSGVMSLNGWGDSDGQGGSDTSGGNAGAEGGQGDGSGGYNAGNNNTPGPGDTGGEGGNNPKDDSTSQYGGGKDNTGAYDEEAAKKQKEKEKKAEQQRIAAAKAAKEKADKEKADKEKADAIAKAIKEKEEEDAARAKELADLGKSKTDKFGNIFSSLKEKNKKFQNKTNIDLANKRAFQKYQDIEQYVDMMDDYSLTPETLAKEMAKNPAYGYDFSDLDKGLATLTSNKGTSIESTRPNLYDVNSPVYGITGLIADKIRPDTQVTALNTLRKARDYRDLAGTGDVSREDLDNLRNRGKTQEQIDIMDGNNRDGGDNYVPPIVETVKEETEEEEVDPRDYSGLGARIMGSIFDFSGLADGGIARAGYMDGGMPEYQGGIMDLETGRQQYFLGKLVKKATRAVKKIAKSPLGKAAILGGMAYFGGGGANMFKSKGLPGMFKTFFSKKNPLAFTNDKFSFSKGLGLTTLAPFLFPGEEEKDGPMNLGPDFGGLEGVQAMRLKRDLANRFRGTQFVADGGRIGYAEGSKEPVAKETMPLLDMDNQEMDLRQEGGFVPIGRMERADDVPARLSKNEFVFTADAVRNAGEGDIDKGAEVMYNMMKNLESGGEVSEESQGLDGAREMFKTSQRLEEVL